MGCAPSTPEDALDRHISKELKHSKRAQERVVNLLLLGAGECGKSTICKQMKILEKGGFAQEEKLAFVRDIHRNVFVAINCLLRAAEEFAYDLQAANVALDEEVRAYDTSLPLSPDMAAKIAKLWADPALKRAWKEGSSKALPDSTEYFLDKVTALAGSFTPNNDDILHSRKRTIGIAELNFAVNGTDFKVVDVGGQRSERRKWISCFNDCTSIIFTAALSEYDQVLMEDKSKNRMHESVALFAEILSFPFSEHTSFILFLNKDDVFRDKVQKTDLKCAYPDYKGGLNYDQALKFIQNLYWECARQQFGDDWNSRVFTHVTCATNTKNVSTIWKSCRDTMIQEVLNSTF